MIYQIGDAGNWLTTRAVRHPMAHYFYPGVAKSVCGKAVRPTRIFGVSPVTCLGCSDSLWARNWKQSAAGGE